MQRRGKVELCFRVEQALERCDLLPTIDGLIRCPFHRHTEHHYFKYYAELNAVACLSASCPHYQRTLYGLDMLELLLDLNRTEARKMAEEILVEELEEYRAERQGMGSGEGGKGQEQQR